MHPYARWQGHRPPADNIWHQALSPNVEARPSLTSGPVPAGIPVRHNLRFLAVPERECVVHAAPCQRTARTTMAPRKCRTAGLLTGVLQPPHRCAMGHRLRIRLQFFATACPPRPPCNLNLDITVNLCTRGAPGVSLSGAVAGELY